MRRNITPRESLRMCFQLVRLVPKAIQRKPNLANWSPKFGLAVDRATTYDIASWILMATALLLVLLLHLLPGLVVGLATYELVQLVVEFLKIVKIHHIRAKLAAVSLVSLGVVTII